MKATTIRIDDEMLGRVDGLAEVERGEVATDEEVVAKFRKCRTLSA